MDRFYFYHYMHDYTIITRNNILIDNNVRIYIRVIASIPILMKTKRDLLLNNESILFPVIDVFS